MIVLDEGIHGHFIIKPIASWYSGRVISVTALRPKTVIKDDAIPSLLRSAPRPTFITINTTDFWRIASADSRYCILCFDLDAKQIKTLPDSLRRLLQMTEFKTRESRLGKVARVRSNRIDYYELDKRVHTLTRSD
jgi:hypothetical protein